MQSEVTRRPGVSAWRVVAAVLIAYGALGVAVNLRLFTLLFSAVGSWFGLPDAAAAPPSGSILAPLQAHFDALPWLPWAAWLVGVALLGFSLRPRTSSSTSATEPVKRGYPWWLPVALLVVLVVLAGYLRMAELWPPSYGISQFPYDDEGVYAGASQLLVQGILPYRDFFFAHPPVAAVAYAPAMLYHFTEWGSPTSFMDARYLSVFYSLVTLVLVLFIALRLSGIWGAALSGLLWAFDGRIIEINRKVMLDVPMVLLSCAGLLLYLWVRPSIAGDSERGAPRRTLLVLGLAGAVAALSALTKIAGVACLVAIVTDLLWLHFDNRRLHFTLSHLLPQLLSLVVGAVAVAVVVLGPFLVIAPSQITREIIFFQVLRPSDGLIDIPQRIADIASTFDNALTALFAALGFIVVSVWVWRRSSPDVEGVPGALSPWRTLALWTFFSLLLFTYSRSFYSHYYIQLAAPLCLLGSGVALLPKLLRQAKPAATADQPPIQNPKSKIQNPALLWLVFFAVIALPFFAVEWQGAHSRAHENRSFELVGKYVNDAVKPGTPVLTTDEQFNFLAARPPSHNNTGYLVDSYGHMIYLGLQLNTRDWSDLIQSALKGKHSDDAYAVLHLPPAQTDMLDRARNVPLIVIHEKGVPRFTQGTLGEIAAESKVVEQQRNYTIYRVTNTGASK